MKPLYFAVARYVILIPIILWFSKRNAVRILLGVMGRGGPVEPMEKGCRERWIHLH